MRILSIAQVGSIILRLPSKESRMDFLINLLLPQDKTSLDSPLVISFSTFILSNRCVSHGCCKDWKNWSVNSDHFPWFVTSMTCPYVWQYENWKIGPNCGPRGIAENKVVKFSSKNKNFILRRGLEKLAVWSLGIEPRSVSIHYPAC